MKRTLFIQIISLIGFLAVNLSADEKRVWKKGDPFPYPRTGLNEMIIRSSVTWGNNVFDYLYVLDNPPKNKFPIIGFQIDLRDNPATHPLDNRDLTIEYDLHRHINTIRNSAGVHLIRQIIPNMVGWEFERGEIRTNGYWATDRLGLVDNTTIMPGKWLSGFGMVANEPPGIREFVVNADLSLLESKFPLPCKTDTECDFFDYSDEFRIECAKGIQYLGKTLAPVKPPEPFTISSWTTRMTEYAIEARKQKWIKMDKNLTETKKLISSLNTDDRAKLKAAVKKIEAYVLTEKKKANLTDEADALIRLNALYLLDRVARLEVKISTGTGK